MSNKSASSGYLFHPQQGLSPRAYFAPACIGGVTERLLLWGFPGSSCQPSFYKSIPVRSLYSTRELPLYAQSCGFFRNGPGENLVHTVPKFLPGICWIPTAVIKRAQMCDELLFCLSINPPASHQDSVEGILSWLLQASLLPTHIDHLASLTFPCSLIRGVHCGGGKH